MQFAFECTGMRSSCKWLRWLMCSLLSLYFAIFYLESNVFTQIVQFALSLFVHRIDRRRCEENGNVRDFAHCRFCKYDVRFWEGVSRWIGMEGGGGGGEQDRGGGFNFLQMYRRMVVAHREGSGEEIEMEMQLKLKLLVGEGGDEGDGDVEEKEEHDEESVSSSSTSSLHPYTTMDTVANDDQKKKKAITCILRDQQYHHSPPPPPVLKLCCVNREIIRHFREYSASQYQRGASHLRPSSRNYHNVRRHLHLRQPFRLPSAAHVPDTQFADFITASENQFLYWNVRGASALQANTAHAMPWKRRLWAYSSGVAKVAGEWSAVVQLWRVRSASASWTAVFTYHFLFSFLLCGCWSVLYKLSRISCVLFPVALLSFVLFVGEIDITGGAAVHQFVPVRSHPSYLGISSVHMLSLYVCVSLYALCSLLCVHLLRTFLPLWNVLPLQFIPSIRNETDALMHERMLLAFYTEMMDMPRREAVLRELLGNRDVVQVVLSYLSRFECDAQWDLKREESDI